MNEEEKDILLYWTPVLLDSLNPLTLSRKMDAFLLTGESEALFSPALGGPISQTEKFIDLMIKSKEKDIYDQFVRALLNTDHIWLAPIFDNRFAKDDQENAVIQSDQLKLIYEKFRELMGKEEINFNVEDITNESGILNPQEREQALAYKNNHGRLRAIDYIIAMVIRKGPDGLTNFYNALKKTDFGKILLPLIEELDSAKKSCSESKIKSLGDSEEEQMDFCEGPETSVKQLQAENLPDKRGIDDGKVRAFVNDTMNVDESKSVADPTPAPHPEGSINVNNVSSTLESSMEIEQVLPGPVEPNDNMNNENDDLEDHQEEEMVANEEENELEFRDYQEELAEQAKRGENSLVVAPTGTGKTFVALCVCLDHLQKKGKKAKIIFMVPKVPLIKQQHEVLRKYVNEDYAVEVISGGDPEIPVIKYIKQSQIVVMTPQILVDHLVSYENRYKKKDDLLRIQELTLLIFDECHHVSKGDPFNKIMNCYFDEQIKSRENLPQILGLTASPGIGPAKTHQKAEDSLKTLLGNLDVVTPPKRVVRCIESLREKEVKENTQTCPIRKREADQFEISIKTVMDKIEALIKLELSKNKDCKLMFNAKAQGSQVYEATVVQFHNDSAVIDNKVLSEKLMKYSRHLREYNNSLHLNDHVRATDAIKYIERTLFSRFNKNNEVEIKLKKLYTTYIKTNTPRNSNPLLNKLRVILVEEFEKKSEDSTEGSRCIIFVKTRAIANGLVSFLKDSKALAKYKLNPTRLTGANAKDDNYGKTKADQDQTIKAFREGRCKLIVATSVGEEGLDIPACNLMITYNYSTNEIGQVQRKGRARAMNSKTVMLAYDDSDIIKREKVNKIRVELTDEIMDKLDKMFEKKPNKLRNEIVRIQKSRFDERDLERAALSRSMRDKPSASDMKWIFMCKNCKAEVTDSTMFRHITNQHHFVVDPQFDKKAHFVVDEAREVFIAQDQFLVGKTYCGEPGCRYDWGMRMKFKNCYISVLKIKSFVLEYRGEKVNPKKWKDAPFVVTKSASNKELKNLMPKGPGVQNTDANSDSEDEELDLMWAD